MKKMDFFTILASYPTIPLVGLEKKPKLFCAKEVNYGR